MLKRKHRKVHSLFSTNKAENDKAVTYNIRFIDSLRFMLSLLSSLADNFVEGLHNNKCKDCKSCFGYMKVRE